MRTFVFSTLIVFAGCGGDGGAEDADPTDTTMGDDDDTMGDDDDDDGGAFSIEATAIDVSVSAPATEGLCVDLLDPSPALTGGEPELLLTTTIGANGAILFEDVVTESTLGLLMSVKDCGTPNQITFTSATGIAFESIDGLGDGDVLTGQTAFVIPMAMLAGMQASAEVVGYAGSLEAEGMMFGFTLDTTAAPVSGVTVTCIDCGPTYYMDADATDGLFSSAAGPNTATDAAAGAVWIIPGGPINSYTAEDGGAHAWEAQLNGSNPGSATCTAFFGQ